MQINLKSATLLGSVLLGGNVMAAVSPEEAARLGQDLTPWAPKWRPMRTVRFPPGRVR